MAEDFENIKKSADVDMVNRPPHYNREGAMECFDEFMLIYGKEAAKHACLFNIHKYRYRAADKNGQEDLKKSDWYMRKYKELCTEDTIKDTSIIMPKWSSPATIQPVMPYDIPNITYTSVTKDYGQF